MKLGKNLTHMNRRSFLRGTANLAASAAMPGTSSHMLQEAFRFSKMPEQLLTPALVDNYLSSISFYTHELSSFSKINIPEVLNLLQKAQIHKSPELDKKIIAYSEECLFDSTYFAEDITTPFYASHLPSIREEALKRLPTLQKKGHTLSLTEDQVAQFSTPEGCARSLRHLAQDAFCYLQALQDALTDEAQEKLSPFSADQLYYFWDGELLVQDYDFNQIRINETFIQFLMESNSVKWQHMPLNLFNLPPELQNILRTQQHSLYQKAQLYSDIDMAGDANSLQRYFLERFGLTDVPDFARITPDEVGKIVSFQENLYNLPNTIHFQNGAHIDDICSTIKNFQGQTLDDFCRSEDSRFDWERYKDLYNLQNDYLDDTMHIQQISADTDTSEAEAYTLYQITFTHKDPNTAAKKLTSMQHALKDLTQCAIFCPDTQNDTLTFKIPTHAVQDFNLIQEIINYHAAKQDFDRDLETLSNARKEQAQPQDKDTSNNTSFRDQLMGYLGF